LAADRLARGLLLADIGLPVIDGEVGVGADRTLRCGQDRVRLQAGLGCELAGALGPALEPDRAVAILVTLVVSEPGGEVAAAVARPL
jgi:hypothetical protein